MELRPIFTAVLILGFFDLAKILIGNNPAAATAQVSEQINAENAALGISAENRTDGWSADHKGVKISYCTSCSMKGAFTQVKQYIEQEFPGTPVLGETYPIAPHKELLKKVVVAGQVGVAITIFAGDHILMALKISDPQLTGIIAKMRDRKVPLLCFSFLIGNIVSNALSSTGAFEVFSSGKIIFSKLEMGRLPNLEELYDGLSHTLATSSPMLQ